MKTKFTFKQFIVPDFWIKLAFMLPGVFFMGVTLSVLIEIGWGTDPASFMNLNIAHVLNWGLGNTEVLVYGIMFIITFICGPQMIGFGTLANMILIGYIADLFKWIWKITGFHDFILGASLPVTLVIFIVTLILFVIVASLYMNAQMGVAPYDALPAIISGALPKIPYFIIRILFDFSAVGVGLLAAKFSPDGLQGSVIGSVCMSIMLGPVISLVGNFMKKLVPAFRDEENNGEKTASGSEKISAEEKTSAAEKKTADSEKSVLAENSADGEKNPEKSPDEINGDLQ